MKRTTTWGIYGAILFLVAGLVCSLVPYDSSFYGVAHRAWYVCYPVIAVWTWIFKMFGVEGDQGMAFFLPILATTFLYLIALGYGTGFLASGVFRSR